MSCLPQNIDGTVDMRLTYLERLWGVLLSVLGVATSLPAFTVQPLY